MIYKMIYMQVLYDLCMCGLFWSCTSTSCCVKRGVFNFSSWEDEAGESFSDVNEPNETLFMFFC